METPNSSFMDTCLYDAILKIQNGTRISIMKYAFKRGFNV